MSIVKERISSLIRELEDLKSSIPDGSERLGSHPDHYNPLYFHHSDWDCKESPTKFCMYTKDYDTCIFCYEPDERK
jgi:hypothetical protein